MERVGPYEIEELLGQGDFASVYRVVIEGRNAAIKVCAYPRPEAIERLKNEATVLRELSHPSIPGFVDEGEVDDRPYVVMELAPGRTLQRLLRDRQALGSFFGDLATLRILHGLLSTLAYLHGSGWVHRDVKTANVLAVESESLISLIDYGFCKRDRSTLIRTTDSFWRAGAARYSPPAKLDSPGTAVAVHDVFAAGVIGYQLLTGNFPWSVSNTSDIGELRREMLTSSPTPVCDLNSTVRTPISDFVMCLLEREDAVRPSSAEAFNRASELIAELTASGVGPILQTAIIPMPHVSRDPLHGDVRITNYERRVLDTPQMQRLRWIRQLGLTNMVYLGADHSRMSHAVGTMFRAEQMLSSIEDFEGIRIDRDTRLTARLYALIHDVVHVAFGHTVEDELGLFERHDENHPRAHRLILDEKSELGRLLRSSDVGQQVLAHFDPDASINARSSIRELISGPTGADVLDYIDRDALFCGLDHRVDSALFRQLRLAGASTQDNHLVSLLYGRHGVRVDRSFAVESLLRERYALFLKVYTHKRKAAASALLGKALSLALRPPGKGRPEFSESDYEWMGDETIIEVLKGSKKTSVSSLATDLKHRRLPVPVYRALLLPEEPDDIQYTGRQTQLRTKGVFDPYGRAQLEAHLAQSARVDPQRVIIYCPPRAPGYQRVHLWVSESPGTHQPMDELQRPFLQIGQRHLRLWELWVFLVGQDESAQTRVAMAASEEFGFSNKLGIDRRQERLF